MSNNVFNPILFIILSLYFSYSCIDFIIQSIGLIHFQFLPGRKLEKRGMRLFLIPESSRRDIRFLWQITVSMSPTQILNSNSQVFLKPYRIHHMPAIHSESLSGSVGNIGRQYLYQSGIRCCKSNVLPVPVEIIRSAEIILSSGSYDGRELLVSIHEEFDFSFAPPAIVIHLPGHIDSYIVPFSLYSVDNGIIGGFIHFCAAELCMEIGSILRYIGQRIIDLIIEVHRLFIIDISHGDPAFFAERHHPITIERTTRIDGYRQGIQMGIFIPPHAEEITHRCLY